MYEIERKFLLKELPQENTDTIVNYIEQYYLPEENGFDIRIRRESNCKNDSICPRYLLTEKKYDIEKSVVIENENEITETEWNELSLLATHQIVKHRYIFYDDDNKWEVDIFENIHLIIAEFEMIAKNDDELSDMKEEISFINIPPFIGDHMIMEVTELNCFSNKKLAKKIYNV